jgi:hypothetical protein
MREERDEKAVREKKRDKEALRGREEGRGSHKRGEEKG